MGLAIFAVFVIIAIVLFFLIALDRVSFTASMVIFGIFFLIFFVCLPIFLDVNIGEILKLAAIPIAIGIVLLIISYYTASGLTSLSWWLNKDITPIKKEKKKTCPACGADNMLGRLFCVKCGKQMIFPANVKNLKISRRAATDMKKPEKSAQNGKNTSR